MELENDFKTTLVSRHVMIFGKRTTVRLDRQMWAALKEIAKLERCKTNDLCTLIYAMKKTGTTLSAAVRQFLMLYYKSAATDEGHKKAGHGDFTRMLARARLNDTDKEKFMMHCTVNRALCQSCCLNDKCLRGKLED